MEKQSRESKITELEIKKIECLGFIARCTDRPSLISMIMSYNKNEKELEEAKLGQDDA